jgi:hypothetical protein
MSQPAKDAAPDTSSRQDTPYQALRSMAENGIDNRAEISWHKIQALENELNTAKEQNRKTEGLVADICELGRTIIRLQDE